MSRGDAAMLANPQGRSKECLTSVERQIELTAESLWSDVSARLREALNDTTYQTWFGDVGSVELEGQTFAIVVPNDFTREWHEGNVLDLIRATVNDAGVPGRGVSLRS